MKCLLALGFALTALASPVWAHHIEQRPVRPRAIERLLSTAEGAGVTVFTEKDPTARGHCQPGVYGRANVQKQLLICVRNHEGDERELADTIRHELIHNAQYCKGGLLWPNLKGQMLEVAATYLHMPVNKYPKKAHHREAEARVAAQVLSEEQVGALVKDYCGA